MDNAIQSLHADDTFHVEDSRERLGVSWKNSFCSANSPWQQQWVLLSCALHCLGKEVVLLLAGFNDELYQTLDEGLRYLDPKYYANPSRSYPGNSFSIRRKALIVGTPRSEALRRDEQFDTLASLSRRIDEGAEREGMMPTIYKEFSVPLTFASNSMLVIAVLSGATCATRQGPGREVGKRHQSMDMETPGLQ
jgi:hypothetical protein